MNTAYWRNEANPEKGKMYTKGEYLGDGCYFDQVQGTSGRAYRYWEGDRCLVMDVTFLKDTKSLGVFSGDWYNWQPPYDGERITQAKRYEIVSRLQLSTGRVPVVDLVCEWSRGIAGRYQVLGAAKSEMSSDKLNADPHDQYVWERLKEGVLPGADRLLILTVNCILLTFGQLDVAADVLANLANDAVSEECKKCVNYILPIPTELCSITDTKKVASWINLNQHRLKWQPYCDRFVLVDPETGLIVEAESDV